jgi:hypothetical protein
MDYTMISADDLATAMRTSLSQDGAHPSYRKIPPRGANRAAARIAALLAGR